MAEAGNTYPVAVINSNEDIVESIRLILEDAGILSISGHQEGLSDPLIIKERKSFR